MDTTLKAKIGTVVIGLFTSLFGALAIPMLCLVLSNIIDYVTGILASKYRGQKISSYMGIKGIVKKVCTWLLVVVGVIADEILIYSIEVLGWNVPFTFMIACVVAIWLVFNELISILENVSDIGVNLPPFLKKMIVNLKTKVETTADVFEEEEEE